MNSYINIRKSTSTKYMLPALECQGPKEEKPSCLPSKKLPFGRLNSHIVPIWVVMANKRNTNLWDAIDTHLGSLVYILNQTPASDPTCSVHQLLVESLKEWSDPGTCTAAGCFLDRKMIMGGICKEWFHEPILTQIWPKEEKPPWLPSQNVNGTDSVWRQSMCLKPVWNQSETNQSITQCTSIKVASNFFWRFPRQGSNYQNRIRKLHLLRFCMYWNRSETPWKQRIPPAIRTLCCYVTVIHW